MGFRKRKGSKTLLWLISLHSGKSLLPAPSQPSLPPHMSHRGGYCYSVIWKSQSSLLSVPSPAIHKEGMGEGIEAKDAP